MPALPGQQPSTAAVLLAAAVAAAAPEGGGWKGFGGHGGISEHDFSEWGAYLGPDMLYGSRTLDGP
eukprot:1152756-Pelagomonas_calceolata.AAC.1